MTAAELSITAQHASPTVEPGCINVDLPNPQWPFCKVENSIDTLAQWYLIDVHHQKARIANKHAQLEIGFFLQQDAQDALSHAIGCAHVLNTTC